MKKQIKVLALILVLALVLCSCGKSDEIGFADGLDDYGYFKGIKATDYVTLGKFDTIELNQSEIDAAILELCTDYGNETEVNDRAVVDGDKFYFDFVGKMDGVAFENGSAENATGDLRNNTYIPGLLEGVIGHYPGETFDVDVTFPETYSNNPDLAGKAATFTITLNTVVDRTPAEFTDEFVSTHFASSGYNTAQDIRDFFKLQLLEVYIMSNATVNEIPEVAQTWAEHVAVKSNQLYAKNYYQVEEITFLKQQYGVETEEEFLEAYASQVTQEAQTAVMFQAIAESEGIKISDDDAKAYDTGSEGGTYENYVETFGLPYYKMMIMQDKIMDKLLERAVLK